MTEDELKSIEARPPPYSNAAAHRALVAEVRRLMGLIKTTFNNLSRADCQWCDGDGGRLRKHAADCPAFTPDGVVR